MNSVNRSIETIPDTTPSTVETPSKDVNKPEVPVKEANLNKDKVI